MSSTKNQIKVVRNLPGIAEFRIGFVGTCFGIVLRNRYEKDNHICFVVVVEDDETWYELSSNGGSSSSWIPELIDALRKASRWIEHNAIQDPDGYKFKD